MKRTLYIVIASLLALFMLAGCAAPVSEPAAEPAKEEAPAAEPAKEEPAAEEPAEEPAEEVFEPKLVGLSFPTSASPRFVTECELMEKLLTEMGHKVISQWAEADNVAQLNQCENMLSQGIDLLIICANDVTAAAEIADKCAAEDVPVLSYCRLIVSENIIGFVGEDPWDTGEMQGQFIADNVPEGSNIALLSGDPSDNNAVTYREAAMSVIKPLVDKGYFNLVFDHMVAGWRTAEAMAQMENALTANDNNIQGILCTNDTTANGSSQALAAAGMAGQVILTGGDGELHALKRIYKGTQTMTVFKDPRVTASSCVDVAAQILAGKEPEWNNTTNNGLKDVNAFMTEQFVVTKDNIEEICVDSGWVTMEELTAEDEA